MKKIKLMFLLIVLSAASIYAQNANAGEDQETCGNTTQLEGNMPATGSGFWTIVAGAGAFEDPTDPITTVNGLYEGINTFMWNFTDNETFDEVTITNNIFYTSAGQDQTVDVANAMMNALEPGVGQTATWSIISGAGNFGGDIANNLATVTNLGYGPNTFRWYVYDSTTGCDAFDDVVITNIGFALSAGEDQTICGDSTRMDAQEATAGTIAYWSITSGNCDFVGDISNPKIDIVNIQPGILTLHWNAERNGYTVSDEVVIHTMPEPNFTINPQDAGCHPFNVNLINTPSVDTFPGTLYNWYFDGNIGELTDVTYDSFVNRTFVNPNVPFNPDNPVQPHDSIYNVKLVSYVRINTTLVCSDTITKAVTVWAVPYVAFDIDGGGQILSNPTMIGVENISSPNFGNDAYSWDFGNGVAPPPEGFVTFFSVPYYNSGTYTMTLTITNEQCSADSSQTFVIYSSANIETNDNEINIFPNPTSNFVKIDSDLDCQISLIDLKGKNILQTTEKEIDLSNLEKGMYILQIKTDSKTYFKQIIKQ